MLKSFLLAFLIVSCGCAGIDIQGAPDKPARAELNASGDSSATFITCKNRKVVLVRDLAANTETETITCTESSERTAVGGAGSGELYKTIGTFASLLFGAISIAIQALR